MRLGPREVHACVDGCGCTNEPCDFNPFHLKHWPLLTIYSQFRDEYLTRSTTGGQAAASALIEKVQHNLVLGLGVSAEKVKALPVMVKAYANLHGLGQCCVRDQRLPSVAALSTFWAGFSRSSPLVEFIDVGPGKEADSKLRREYASLVAIRS